MPDIIAASLGLAAGLGFIALVSIVGSYLKASRRIDAARLARGTRRPLNTESAGVINRVGSN